MLALTRIIDFLNRHEIAKRNRFFAYYRLISWQLRSRLDRNRLYTFPFINGTKFYAKRNLTGITGSIYTGLHDFEEMSFLLHFLREDDCFFDVGANVGVYTILASGVRNCKVVAFEPNANTFDLLTKNVKLNNAETKVQCINKGVGSKKGTLKFTTGGDTTNHVISSYEDSLPFCETEIVALDDFAQQSQPRLMKIDVEGFEAEVIKGASSILSDDTLNAIIIELNGSGGRYGFDEMQIHKTLLDFSFYPYTYEPFTKNLIKQETFGLYNTIYLRNLDFVEERIATSQQFKIWNTTI